VPAASSRNVAVTITPTANHEAVAEQTLSLMFSVIKGTARHDRHVRAGLWPKSPQGAVRGKTLGIFGLGRIGRSLATRAKAMGMKVIAAESAPLAPFVAQQGIEVVDFDTLLARSDVLSLHAPLMPATTGIINKTTIAKMKRGAVLINTARGLMVNERDLVAALESGHLAGAGLDVFEKEPPDGDNPLFKLENVVLTPHVAGGDELSLVQMGVEAAQCIVALSRGQWPDGAVINDQLRSSWKW
jgi:phosphoglycerate dehydrogenase-like enzyme